MWRPRAVLLLAASLRRAAQALPSFGWETGTVRHRFLDTPKGQLHYVVGGDVTSGEPLVLFHGHPRSSTTFKYVMGEDGLNFKVPFVAFDFFGMGMSDNYKGVDERDTFCPFEKFAGYAIKALDVEGVRRFISVGHLKGSHPALEIAAQAGASRLVGLVMIDALILSPKAKDFINDKLIPMVRNQKLSADGSHLLQAWKDTSDAPMSPEGAPWDHGNDLFVNQEKTNDDLRCFATGWQYQAAWTAFNEQNVPRLSLVDSFARSLLIFGEGTTADLAKYGLDPKFSLDKIASALTHGRSRNVTIKAGGQGMLSQNATVVAQLLEEFMAQRYTVQVV